MVIAIGPPVARKAAPPLAQPPTPRRAAPDADRLPDRLEPFWTVTGDPLFGMQLSITPRRRSKQFGGVLIGRWRKMEPVPIHIGLRLNDGPTADKLIVVAVAWEMRAAVVEPLPSDGRGRADRKYGAAHLQTFRTFNRVAKAASDRHIVR